MPPRGDLVVVGLGARIATGIDALTSGGRFPLRLILRSSVMPGYEIRSEVTALREVPVDAAAFAAGQAEGQAMTLEQAVACAVAET